jgi:hypothetical protein
VKQAVPPDSLIQHSDAGCRFVSLQAAS